MTITNQVMKTLVVDELRTTLEQSLTINAKTVLERVLPHLYIQGTPSGSIQLRILQGATVASVAYLELADIIAQAQKTLANYHGYVSFKFPKPPILKPGEYTVELEALTYAYDDDTFVGWVMLPSDEAQMSRLKYPHDLRLVEIRAP